MKTFCLTLVCLMGLFSLQAQIKPASNPYLQEVPVFEFSRLKTYQKVEMGYASARIQNPEVKSQWEGKKVYQVDLVFTKYPHNLEDWIINYEVLLQKRLVALAELDSQLLADPLISWNYILQTDCDTEPAAKKLFHGFSANGKSGKRGG